REVRDLYALTEIAAIAQAWPAPFEFVPVLSALDEETPWDGARGLVTERIARFATPESQAYLCGPPPMVDAARAELTRCGVDQRHVRFDRFTTLADAPTEQPSAGVLHYLKFFSFHLVGLVSFAALVGGEWITTAGLVGIVAAYVLGDALLGDDTSTPAYRHPQVLTAQLWLALPLLALIVFTAVWTVCATDVLGFGAFVQSLTGFDAVAARDATPFGHHLAGAVMTGLMIGMVGTIPAHELTHRTWDPVSMFVGRWLLAFSFDTAFSIEHVYGHHRYVSTTADPATAPRGRNVYAHILISTLRGHASAWRIEKNRLDKKRLAVWSHHNAYLRGQGMSALLVVMAAFMGGGSAAAYFVAIGLWGKALLEIVNYMEHYGMVRNPTLPVEPRHSWNTNRRVTSWSMFNLSRHSHHHAQGEVPYHELRPHPDAPVMIGGYLTTLIVAMVPPLWHRLMTPKLLEWDRLFATPEERRLAAQANAQSGIRALGRAPQLTAEAAG
ncbi:MAG: fatty acid desaturase, partial [Myxococcota bacterium]